MPSRTDQPVEQWRQRNRSNRKRDLLLALIWAAITLPTLPPLLGSWAWPVALATEAVFIGLASQLLDRRSKS